jgi:histidine triad (HIT) family protein
MPMECVFCQIAAGDIPADIVYQDKEIIAFRDMHPQAPTHLLIIPKDHVPSLLQFSEKHRQLIGHLVLVANDLAEKEGISTGGFRLSVSCGPDGGQVVPHVHFHLLGGRKLDGRLG